MTPLPLLALLALAGPESLLQDVRVAVIAGNNVGLDGEQPLEFAEEDARRVHALLTSLGGVAPRRSTLVLGGRPDDLLRAVSEATGQLRELSGQVRTSLLLYVSSHGDEEDLHLGGERLPLARLRGLVAGAPANLRVVVVDACRLPHVARGKGGRPVPEIPVVFDRSAQVEGEVYIAAAGPGERAQEWSHLRGSLFTHHLLTGLRGAADFDGNAKVTLAEAYAYAFRATLSKAAESGPEPQRPSFDFRLQGHGDWVFSQTEAAVATLTLAPDLAGRVWVVDARSDVVAEVEKRSGEPVRLALVPGLYRVVRIEGAQARAADVNLSFGGARAVESASLVRVPASRALGKGGPALRLRPWTVSASFGVVWAGAGGPVERAFDVGAERAFGDFAFRLAAGAGWTRFDAGGGRISQQDVRLAAALSRTFPLGIGTGAIGVEMRPRLVRQRIDQSRSEVVQRIYGLGTTTEEAFLFAAGPVASASLPISDRFVLGAAVSVGIEFAPDADGRIRTRGYAAPRLLIGWSY